MNIKTGVFTAPRNGTYHFAFAFLRDGRIPKFVSIFLRNNGATIGTAQAFALTGVNLQGSLPATLKLKSGDKVDLFQVNDGTIYDDPNHYFHFNGWLGEEDLEIPS